MFVNMEFIIYLCFKCTYKLLKCMSVFTRVYSLVCLQCVLPCVFCNASGPEQSHNVLGLWQPAPCFLFPFLPSVLMKSLYWIHRDLNIIHVHPRSLNIQILFWKWLAWRVRQGTVIVFMYVVLSKCNSRTCNLICLGHPIL